MVTVLTSSHLKYLEPEDIMEFVRVLTPCHKMEMLENPYIPPRCGHQNLKLHPVLEKVFEGSIIMLLTFLSPAIFHCCATL